MSREEGNLFSCTKCGVEYPRTLENFITHKAAKDGMTTWCRQCYRDHNARWRKSQAWERRVLKAAYDRHVKRWPHVVFDITEGTLRGLVKEQDGRCYWFGVPFTYEVGSGLSLVSIDRLNNDLGYTADNIVLVCDAANTARRDYSESEFKQFVCTLTDSLIQRRN